MPGWGSGEGRVSCEGGFPEEDTKKRVREGRGRGSESGGGGGGVFKEEAHVPGGILTEHAGKALLQGLQDTE